MKGDHLPANDHVVRYCAGSKLAEDGTPLAAAFFLRRNEKYLSVEWLEYLQQHAKDDPAHAGIHDTAQDEMMIAELITETVETLYPFP